MIPAGTTLAELERSYEAPHCTQHGVDSTLNDCAACALVVNLAVATLGEFTQDAQGNEMSRDELQRMVRQIRVAIEDTIGGLDLTQVQQACVELGFPRPESVDIRFPQFLAGLKSRQFTYWLAGDPSRIKGASPRKRCDCSHAWAVTDIFKDGDLTLHDPLFAAPSGSRGERVPAAEVRQMAFKDSDGALNLVLRFPRGGWTRAELGLRTLRRTAASLRAKLEVQEARIVELKRRLDEGQPAPDCDDQIKTARIDVHRASIAWHEGQIG